MDLDFDSLAVEEVSFDFARGGLGEFFLLDFEVFDTLIRRDSLVHLVNYFFEEPLHVNFVGAFAGAVEGVEIGDDYGVGFFAVVSHEADYYGFEDEGGLVYLLFNLLRIDIFAGGGNDDVFLAAFEE